MKWLDFKFFKIFLLLGSRKEIFFSVKIFLKLSIFNKGLRVFIKKFKRKIIFKVLRGKGEKIFILKIK